MILLGEMLWGLSLAQPGWPQGKADEFLAVAWILGTPFCLDTFLRDMRPVDLGTEPMELMIVALIWTLRRMIVVVLVGSRCCRRRLMV